MTKNFEVCSGLQENRYSADYVFISVVISSADRLCTYLSIIGAEGTDMTNFRNIQNEYVSRGIFGLNITFIKCTTHASFRFSNFYLKSAQKNVFGVCADVLQ